MSSSDPAGLDAFANPTSANTLANSTPSHSQQHANLNDAVESLEAKVGIDGSADPDSLDYRVAALEEAPTHTHVSGETPSGAIDGANAVFTLATAPRPAAGLMLFLNGMLQRAGGNDYALSSATVTFAQAPAVGSVLLAHYIA